MNNIVSLLGDSWINAFGWTILHSLWQGLLIAILVTCCLVLLKRSDAHWRYRISLSALVVLLISVGVTFYWSYYAQQTVPYDDPVFNAEVLPAPVSDVEKDLQTEPLVALEQEVENDHISSLKESLFDFFNPNIPLIVLLWLIGVLLLSMRLLGEFIFLSYLRKHAKPITKAIWIDAFESLFPKMNLKRKPGLLQSRRAGGPMVIGFFKPLIIIPIGLINQLSEEEVESILAHELAHVYRLDYLVNILQSLAEIVLFFNPAVWWISNIIRTEREYCCDDLAVNITKDEVGFVKTLARLEEWRQNSGALSLAFAGQRKGVLSRAQRLLKGEPSNRVQFKIFWSMITIISLACFVSFQVPSEPVQQDLIENKVEKKEVDASIPSAEIESDVFDPNDQAEISDALDLEENEPLTLETDHAELEEPTDFAELPMDIVSSVAQDSVPDEESIEKMLEKLELEHETKWIEVESQEQLLEKEAIKLEGEMNKLEMMHEKELNEVRKQLVTLRMERAEIDNAGRIKRKEARLAIMEIEKSARELEVQQLKARKAGDPKADTEMQAKVDAEWKKMEGQESIIHQQELEQQNASLEVRKKIQELEMQMETKNFEWEKKRHAVELKHIELKAKRKQLNYQAEMLENEFQLKRAEMEIKLNEARRKELLREGGE